MNNLLKHQSIPRALVLAIAVMTITVMTGIAHAVPTQAQVTATRIVDGSLIRAHNDIDIYIVKITGSKLFKRLILNPTIFESYGHLRWEDVISVSPQTLNQYKTSDLVREVYPDGSIVPPGMVYRLYPQGDTGIKRHVNMTQAEFEARYDKDSIYGINATEAGPTFYATGSPITVTDAVVTPPTTPTTPTVTNPDAPTVVPTPRSGDGDEGELQSSDTSVDVDDEVGSGETAIVLATELEAVDSDIEIQRVDVSFMSTTADKDTRVWKTFNRVRLILDGEVIASRTNLESDDFVEMTDDSYRLRFSGLEEVIDEDDEARLEVEVRVDSTLTDRREGNSWEVEFNGNAIRGIDEAGIQVYAPGTGATEDATFTVSGVGEGGLTAEKSSEDLDEQVRVSTSEETDGIMVFNIDFENDEDAPDATLQEIKLVLQGTGTGGQWDDSESDGKDLTRFVKEVSVYLGNRQLDSVTIEDGDATTDQNNIVATLNNLDVDFDPGETRTLMVKIDVGEFATGDENGLVTPYLTSYLYEYGEDEEEQPVKSTGTFSAGNAESYKIKGDTITFTALSPVVMEKSATLTSDGEATFVLDISAPEGDGNDVYIARPAQGAGECGSGAFTITGINSNIGTPGVCTISTDAEEVTISTNYWKIEEGETETFTITLLADNEARALLRGKVTSLTWGRLNLGAITSEVAISLDIETPLVTVQAKS